MLKKVGPFRLPPAPGDASKGIVPGRNIRVLSSDEANVYATYCADCSMVWKAPTGSWGIALQFAAEHHNVHAQSGKGSI
jgi:hypothetical protein